MLSAHPMSCLPRFQFGRRYQACQRLSSRMPILVEELASEKALSLAIGWGDGMGDGGAGLSRWWVHHFKLPAVP